jgi:hypothetical protein
MVQFADGRTAKRACLFVRYSNAYGEHGIEGAVTVIIIN